MQDIQKIIDKVLSKDLLNMPLGRYELDDSNFFMVQSYMSKDESICKLEAHKQYIDVQIVLKGEENIKTCSLDNLEVSEEYDEHKDVVFFDSPNNLKDNILKNGEYLVLPPEVAHKPGIKVSKPVEVRKVVIKIRCE